MPHINIEIKARFKDNNRIREILRSQSADFKGADHQIDTYFNVSFGRLKLREGTIENHLIHYSREDKEGPKQSNVILYKFDPASTLKDLLTRSLGVMTVVDKEREIYFVDNVKFHLDNVKGLGTFVEIEAIDYEGTIGRDELLAQCQYYMELFAISRDDLISRSYSDLIEIQQLQIDLLNDIRKRVDGDSTF